MSDAISPDCAASAPGAAAEQRAAMFLRHLRQCKGVLHLGAHLGQEAKTYEEAGKPVIWVEAMPHIHARLQERLDGLPAQRSYCALLGAEDDVPRTFHISSNGNGVSSSLFEFGEYGAGTKSLWPSLQLKMVAEMSLRSITLDRLLAKHQIDAGAFDFWVVDLQGAELEALAGASRSIEFCNVIYVEASTVEVYRGGALWADLSRFLRNAGFDPLWNPEGGHDDVLLVRRATRSAEQTFHADSYLRHNNRRLEHLATLGLDLTNKSVLEVGAGIGDHTSFYLDRGCTVLVTDARTGNLEVIRHRFAEESRVELQLLDMDAPVVLGRTFDVVHCYGLLYHLTQPAQAIAFLASCCGQLLILETCVTPGEKIELNPVFEPAEDPSQAIHGTGCRPTRNWIWAELKKVFPFVYSTVTQPRHPEFPLEWTGPPHSYPAADAGGICSFKGAT